MQDSAGTGPSTRRGGAPSAALNAALFRWFDGHRRDLAFRRTRDPYAILVAEVMLQQTQVARVEPAWTAFMARFPRVESLAGASLAEVIRAWGGLGYYGRAVRLHRAARALVSEHASRVPGSVGTLVRLPGVGPYTAHAVAATAFGIPIAAVDTNIRRVVRRVHGLDPEAGRPAFIQRAADAWIDRARPAEWTHALMDVGATVCLPREPRCPECPLRSACSSAREPRTRAGRGAGTASPDRRTNATRSPQRFEQTRRWLRGRILARLRDEGDGAWVEIGGPMGTHPPRSVEEAVRQLAADGLVEQDRAGRVRLPQAIGSGPRSGES